MKGCYKKGCEMPGVRIGLALHKNENSCMIQFKVMVDVDKNIRHILG